MDRQHKPASSHPREQGQEQRARPTLGNHVAIPPVTAIATAVGPPHQPTCDQRRTVSVPKASSIAHSALFPKPPLPGRALPHALPNPTAFIRVQLLPPRASTVDTVPSLPPHTRSHTHTSCARSTKRRLSVLAHHPIRGLLSSQSERSTSTRPRRAATLFVRRRRAILLSRIALEPRGPHSLCPLHRVRVHRTFISAVQHVGRRAAARGVASNGFPSRVQRVANQNIAASQGKNHLHPRICTHLGAGSIGQRNNSTHTEMRFTHTTSFEIY